MGGHSLAVLGIPIVKHSFGDLGISTAAGLHIGQDYTLLSAALNTFGVRAPLAAMRSGGKASIIVLLTALYPHVVLTIAPVVLHRTINHRRSAGAVCSLIAVLLLSTETPATETH